MPIQIESLLLLSRVPGIGPRRLRSLVGHLGDPASVLSAPLHALTSVEGIDRTLAQAILSFARGPDRAHEERFVADQIATMDRAGARVITCWDEEYPSPLKRIFDPPAFLFLRGALESADALSIAIVGTRAPSPYGVLMAERFAAGFAALGLTVVSGLARGVDTIAHDACLRKGGRTIAVIGSGIDIIYPPENRSLATRIEDHGAVVSEFIMGTKPDAGNFPQRNRVISGMSLGTVIVETGVEGGAMITAGFALDQNREVFAIPCAVNDQNPSGAHRLIREGKALLVESVDDVLAELAPKLKEVMPRGAVHAEPPAELSLFEKTVFDAMPDGSAIHVDDIARGAKMPVPDILGHLLSLEMKGCIRQRPGKFFLKV